LANAPFPHEINPTSRTGRRSRWRRPIQIVLLSLILAFWGRSLAQNWGEVRLFSWQIRWPWLLLAAVVLLIHQPLVALAWQRIVAALGEPLRIGEALQIYLMAQIARYLPGGVWDVAGRVYLAGEQGHSRARISYSILFEMVLHVVSAALFFLVTLVFWRDVWAIWPIVVAFAGIAALGLLVVYPPVLAVALAWLAQLGGGGAGSRYRLLESCACSAGNCWRAC